MVGEGALGEALQRHPLEQALPLGRGEMREQQLAARTTVRRQRDAALRDVQPQRPGRLDAVEIDERALLQHGEIAGLGDLPDDALQYEAALRRGAVTEIGRASCRERR